MARLALEPRLQLDAPGAGVVDEAGQVVEVDAAFEGFLVGDIAAEGGGFPLAAGMGIADPQAALEELIGGILLRLVEEEVDLGAVGPVGEGEELAIAIGDRVAGGE